MTPRELRMLQRLDAHWPEPVRFKRSASTCVLISRIRRKVKRLGVVIPRGRNRSYAIAYT